MSRLLEKFHYMVPGGSHTYSKGDDQFPANYPSLITHAKGAECWDIDGKRYLDWAMGNRVFVLGHAFDEVDNQVISAIRNSTNYTRPGILEYQLAEYLTDLWPCAEMVKFGKNGSDVTSAAIKLARAATGRDYIAVCGSHPFFSIHDWFIGSTPINSGTLESERKYTLKFIYNDQESLARLFAEYPGQIAGVIMEPIKTDSPYTIEQSSDYSLESCYRKNEESFLQYVRSLTEREGSVLIFDEMISSPRFSIQGAHTLYNVTPDLATYGKAIANGYSCSVLAGKRELMELGGIKHKKERVFLLSQTHGSETTGLAATLATLQFSQSHHVSDYAWSLGKFLKECVKKLIVESELEKFISIRGFDVNPQIVFSHQNGDFWPELHTLFHQYIVEHGILIPWISITYSHSQSHVDETVGALEQVFPRLKGNIQDGSVADNLRGPALRPVFRKWN